MRIIYLTATFICIFAFQNCAPSNVKFSDAEVDLASTAQGAGTLVEKFDTGTRAPLDMIWLIDSSGSMKAEADQVRNNFNQFLSSLDENTDFRMLLISKVADVTLPADPNYLHVKAAVGSTNALSVLDLVAKKAPASSFLRRNSKKMIVTVTDDDSSVTSTQFLNSALFPKDQITVSSFTGLGKTPSPCQTKTGSVYIDLAQKTGGKTYNICDTDWSAHFGDLMNSSINEAQRTFALSQSVVVKINSVALDGQILDPSLYTVRNSSVHIAEHVEIGGRSVVEISYDHK